MTPSADNNLRSDDRTVVVSGASSGIGRAIAVRLAAEGFQVLAGVRSDEAAAEIESEGAGLIVPVRLDITNQADIERIAEMVGGRDIAGLVNNAGTALLGPLEFLPLDRIRQQFETNVFGHIALTQALLPRLRAATGRIVNISSISGLVAFPMSGAYAASKFALEALSDALRHELEPWGISVSLVEPGNVATPIWQKAFDAQTSAAVEFPEEASQYYAQPEGPRSTHGMPSPGDIAEVVAVALTSNRPRSRYLVGRDAKRYARLRRLLPDSLFDRVIRR